MDDHKFIPIIDFDLENKHAALMEANKSIWFVRYDEDSKKWHWFLRREDSDVIGTCDSQENARLQIIEELSK